MADLSERLKEALKMRDITASVLAYKTKISPASISHYIKGDYKPNAKKMKLLADALRVSEAWLDGYDVPVHQGAAAEQTSERADDIIIYHRNGVVVKKRFNDEQMKMIIAMIEAIPDSDSNKF